MFDNLVPICVIGIICLGIYKLTELFVHKRERLLMIEKMSENINPMLFDGKVKLPSFGGADRTFTALKIGCLLAGIGAGFLVGFLLNTFTIVHFDNDHYLTEAAYCASLFLCAGAGLVIAFLIELKYKEKHKDDK